MAFTFTVEDGTGLTGANSYVSVAEALDILFPDTARYDALNAASQGIQESALSLASSYLDTRFQWNGTKYVTTSGLRWPRSNAYDRDGQLIDYTLVPRELKHATALVASMIVSGSASFSDAATTTQAYPITELKVDVLEVNFQVPDTEHLLQIERVPQEIKLILKGLGSTVSGDTTFAKIAK